MEEIIDLSINWVPPEITYLASFDPETGMVTAVGPSHAFEGVENVVPIDQDTAELIIDGRITITSCSVDVTGEELSISETRSAYKIDDVLHRITDVRHADFENFNIYLTYDNNKMSIELSEEFGGTKKLPESLQPVKKKKVNWSGDTDMNFLVSAYNDPNSLYKIFTIKISELLGNKVVLDLEVPKDFSVYTRRIFKNYVIEQK